MVERELERDAAAERQADDVRGLDAEVREQGGRVVRELPDAVGTGAARAATVTAQVERDDAIGAQGRQLVLPVLQARAQAVDEQHRRPVAPGLVVQVGVATAEGRHGVRVSF